MRRYVFGSSCLALLVASTPGIAAAALQITSPGQRAVYSAYGTAPPSVQSTTTDGEFDATVSIPTASSQVVSKVDATGLSATATVSIALTPSTCQTTQAYAGTSIPGVSNALPTFRVTEPMSVRIKGHFTVQGSISPNGAEGAEVGLSTGSSTIFDASYMASRSANWTGVPVEQIVNLVPGPLYQLSWTANVVGNQNPLVNPCQDGTRTMQFEMSLTPIASAPALGWTSTATLAALLGLAGAVASRRRPLRARE